MRPAITCEIHGKQRRAYVCEHVVSVFSGAQPSGFVWRRDDEGEYEALCSACTHMAPAEWEANMPRLAREVCLECFAEAGRRNGILWPNDANT